MALKVREQDTFLQMDAADEQQILREMEGEIVKDLYYDVNGKKGLSYVGVNHMSFKIGGIKIIPESVKVEYDKDTEEYVASVIALNEKYSLTRAGMSVQPKMMEVHDLDADKKWVKNPDGSYKMHLEYDRFARIKALSKAQRNAIKAVMPEALIAAYLDYFIKLKSGARTAQPRDDGPMGMKDPRKVEANAVVKSANPSAAIHDENDEKSVVSREQDIQDALEAAKLDPNGVEITKGRDWGQMIIRPNWGKPASEAENPWLKYHTVLRAFQAVYHGKDDPDPSLRGAWTIGV